MLPLNSTIGRTLRLVLSTDWQEILDSCQTSNTHSLSELECALGQLASLARSDGSYHSSSSVDPRSSPLTNRPTFEASPEHERGTQRVMESVPTPSHSPRSSDWSSPPKMPSSPPAGYSTSGLSPARRQAISQQSLYSGSPPRMMTPSTDMARLAPKEHPKQPRTPSDSSAGLEMDLDASESQSGDFEGSLDWDSPLKLPRHKPMPERLDRGLEQADKAPSSRYSSSSSTGQKSPSANSNVSVSSRYNFDLEPVLEEAKSESDVEHVARLFMTAVWNAIKAAAPSGKGSNAGRWGLSHDILSVNLAALYLRERAKHFPGRENPKSSK